MRYGINGAADFAPRLALEAIAGLDGSTPSEGAFLVPEQFAETIWGKAYDIGRILARCDRQPITVGDKLSLPAIDEISRADGSRFGGARMYWTEEGSVPPSSRPK